MSQAPLPSEPLALGAGLAPSGKFIYIACPWSPAGGGMYKVADYLITAQAQQSRGHAARLEPLDTRGPGSAVASLLVLAGALGKLVRGRMIGKLAGVHVNVAERLSLFRKGSVVIACRALGLPVVIHLHAQMQDFYASLPAPLRALTRWMFSLACAVVVIGAEPRRFVTQVLRVQASRVEIVDNGVPGPASAPVHQPEARVRRVVFVGRLCDAKGVADLLEALAVAPMARDCVEVTLAGNGDIGRYQQLARHLGIDGFVHFAGWCDQAAVQALLRESDLLVLPSHDEVLPLVVLEALANALPVLCTPVGELPGVLTDGDNAAFVPVGDVAALGRRIASLLADDAQRQRLGRNGRDLYEQRFSMDRFFERIARIHGRHFGVSAQAEAGTPAEGIA